MSSVTATERLGTWLAGAAEGNRNSSLFWAACRLAELGLDEASIRDALDRPARSAGLPEREVATTVRSAWRTVQIGPGPSDGSASFRPGRAAVTR